MLIVVHAGAEQETAAWASSRFDLTARAFPKQVAAARAILPADARKRLAAKLLAQSKNMNARAISRLFGWSKLEANEALSAAMNKDATSSRGLG